ncbi:sodium- and chloride-dependent glycine transporter 2-like [Haliotis cracherodii]|uniref:sodium- and chloride-dependent glycine transporter 2-like n=1 Tax=Haliotis cracherodii TaxID=6455 RepID=UPI0039EB5411
MTNPEVQELEIHIREDADVQNIQGTEKHHEVNPQWSNKFQSTLAMLGFSVGMGNLWRFPYVCQRNGGGAFLIPYVIFVVFLSMPLFFLEIALGQFSAQGPIKVWSMCPLMTGIGYGILTLGCLIVPYFSMVFAWALYYIYCSFTPILPWTTCGNTWNTPQCVSVGETRLFISANMSQEKVTHRFEGENTSTEIPSVYGHTSTEEFWQYGVLGISSGIEDLGPVQPHLVVCWFLTCVVVLLCIIRGVRSVGKVVYVTALMPYFLLAVLLVRACMMPGAMDGILFYLTPDFARLQHSQVWLEALIQVFFSMGPSWGTLITLSSHNPFHSNITRTTIVVTVVGGLTSVFAGFVVFATVGFLAHSLHQPIDDVVTSGPGIGFIIYPEAVALLPLPQLWSVLFFLTTLMMVIDSVFANAESALRCIKELLPGRFHVKHLQTVVACVFMGATFLVGLIFTTHGGVYLFTLMDWYVAAVILFVTAVLQCIAVGWLYGAERFSADVEAMTGRPLTAAYMLLSFILIPAALLIVLVLTMATYENPTYGYYKYSGYAVAAGWCIALVSVVPIPITMVMTIVKRNGSLIKRVKASMSPAPLWQKLRDRRGLEERTDANTIKDSFLFMIRSNRRKDVLCSK